MSKLYRGMAPLLKSYTTIILVIVAIFSQPSLAVIPVVLMAVVIFLWWRPISIVINLLTDYFSFFAVAVLMSENIGSYFALLVSLPILILVTRDLEVTAEAVSYKETKYPRYLTGVGVALPLIAVLALIVALSLNSLSLLLSSVVAILYFSGLIALAFRKIPAKPIEEVPVQHRMVAGTKATLVINLNSKTKLGGSLFLKSPYEWLEPSPVALPLKEKQLASEITFSPPLSGPSVIKLVGYVLDRWGLTQTRFELEPLKLHVIPRARYATWLAKRYLTETRAGSLPLISSVGALKPIYGLRVGIEYYGSQLYQPGDSLKNIDWKHSVKYDKLITKEFAEFRGQPAILLINLAVGDAEEADKQAYNTIVTALSLVREQIPTSIAAYNHEEVTLVTARLQPQVLVAQALEVIGQIVTIGKPTKYLKPADVNRLCSNLRRLQYVEGEASEALTGILRIEYTNLKNRARLNSASKALAMAFDRVGEQSSVVVVSPLNHDAEAIMFGAINCGNSGNPVLVV
ncbi:MAG: DUF58 domain-containing protein [Chloroflexi bacterium]|nr:DUF58 domain-containing protein [Chloroflexota bacterium]